MKVKLTIRICREKSMPLSNTILDKRKQKKKTAEPLEHGYRLIFIFVNKGYRLITQFICLLITRTFKSLQVHMIKLQYALNEIR